MIVVRERGVLTPAEIHLAATSEGKELIKQFHLNGVRNSCDIVSMLRYIFPVEFSLGQVCPSFSGFIKSAKVIQKAGQALDIPGTP